MADPIVEELQLDISPALESLTPLASALGDLTTGFSSSLADALTSAFGTPIPGDTLVDTASLTTAVETALTDATGQPLPIEADTTALDATLADSLDTPHVTPVDADVSALDTTISDATDVVHTVPIDGETSELDATVAGALDVPHTIPVDGDVTALDAAVADVTDTTRSVPVEADVSAATLSIDDLAATPIDIPVTADTSSAQDSIDQLAQSATGATGSLDQLGGGVEALKGLSGVATGSVGELVGSISNIGQGAAVATAGIVAFGAVLGESIHLAADAEAQNKRFTATFGAFAEQVQKVDVGGLTISLKDLGAQSGTTNADLEATASRFGELGKSSGAAGPTIVDTTDKLLAIGAAVAVNNPRLGDAAEVTDKLGAAFVRGGRALAPFGISLTAAQIAAEALRETGKSTAAELTIFEKITAGATLAAQQFGDTLGTKFKDGSQNAQVQLRALQISVEETLTAIGGPLLAPLVVSLQAVLPVAQQAGQVIGALGAVVLPLAATLAPALGAVSVPLGLVADGLNGVAGAITHFSAGGPIVVAALGAIGAAALVATFGIDFLVTALVSATVAFATNPFGAVILAVGALGFALNRLGSSTDGAKEAATTFSESLFGTGAGVDSLSGQLAALDTNLDKVLTKLITTGALSEFRQALDDVGGGVKGLRDSLLGSDEAFAKYSDGVAQAAAANGNFFIDGARAKVALDDQREGLVEAQKQQLATLVSTNQLTAEQRKAAEQQNTNTDGTINYVAVLKQIGPEVARVADANKANATATALAGDGVKNATEAFIAHKIGAEELAATLTGLGIAEADVAQITGDLAAEATKTADALILSSPAAVELAAKFGGGRISAGEFESGLFALGVSAKGAKGDLDAVKSAVDAFAKSVGDALPSAATALQSAEQALTSAQNSQKSALEAQVKATGDARTNVEKAYADLAEAHKKGGADGKKAVESAQENLKAALTDGGAKLDEAQAAVEKANLELLAAADPQRVIDQLTKNIKDITEFEANLKKIVAAGGKELAAQFALQGPAIGGAFAAAFAKDPIHTKIAENLIGGGNAAKADVVAWATRVLGREVGAAVNDAFGGIKVEPPDFVTPTKKEVQAAEATIRDHQAAFAGAAHVLGLGGSDKYERGFQVGAPTKKEVDKARLVIDAAKNPHGAAARTLASEASGKYGSALDFPGKTGKNLASASGVFAGSQGQTVALRASIQGGLIGNAFGQGMALGISNRTREVENAAAALGSSAAQAARKAVGASSPSKVAIEIGGFFTEGLALGITAKSPLVAKASEDLTDLITSSLDIARVSAVSLDVKIPAVPLELTPTVAPIAPLDAPVTLTVDPHDIPAVAIDAQVRPVLTPIPPQVAELELQPRLDAIGPIPPLAAELDIDPVIGPLPQLSATVQVQPLVGALPQLTTTALVHPTVDILPVLAASAIVEPLVDPIVGLTAEAQIIPNVDPLPALTTVARVVPTVDPLPALTADVAVDPHVAPIVGLVATAQIRPTVDQLPVLTTTALVHPTVDALPSLSTTAVVHPRVEDLPELATTVTLVPSIPPLPHLAISADVSLDVGALPQLSLTAAVQPVVPDLADVTLTANVAVTVPPLPNADLIANVHPTIPTLANADLTAIVHPTVPALAPTTLQASADVTIPPIPTQTINAVITPRIEIPGVAIASAAQALTVATKSAVLSGFNDPATIAAAQGRLNDLIARDKAAADAAAALGDAQKTAAEKAQAALQALSSFVSSATGQLPDASNAISVFTQKYTASMDKLRERTLLARQSTAAFTATLGVQGSEIAKAKALRDQALDFLTSGVSKGEGFSSKFPKSWFLGTDQQEVENALHVVEGAQQRISEAEKRIQDQMIKTGKLQQELRSAQRELAREADPARFLALKQALNQAAQSLFLDAAHSASLRTIAADKAALKAAQKNLADFISTGASAPNIGAFIANLKAQNAAVKAFQDDLAALVSIGDAKLAEQLAQAGPEAAAALADAFAKSPAKAAAANAAIIQGQAYSDAFETFLGTTFKDNFTPVATDAGATAGKAILFGVKDALSDPTALSAATSGLGDKIAASLPQSVAVPVTITPTAVGPIGSFPTTAPIAVGPTGAGVGAQTFILDLTVLIDGVPTKVAPVTVTVPTPPPSRLTQRVTAEVSAG